MDCEKRKNIISALDKLRLNIFLNYVIMLNLLRILNIYDDDDNNIIALDYIHHFEFIFVALNLYSFIVRQFCNCHRPNHSCLNKRE